MHDAQHGCVYADTGLYKDGRNGKALFQIMIEAFYHARYASEAIQS